MKENNNMQRLTMQLELGNICNVDCIMCCCEAVDERGFRRRAGDGQFSLEGFTRLMKEFQEYPAKEKELTIPWGGEPTVHPHFTEMMGLILAADFCHVNLVTNGLALTEDVSMVLLEYSVFRRHRFNILFSIDAASDETYRLIKGREGFNRLISNIDQLLTLRESAAIAYPTLLLQFVLMEENINEISAFRFLCEEIYKTIDYYEAIENQGIDTSRDGTNIRIIGFTGKSITSDRQILRQLLQVKEIETSSEFDTRPCAYPYENINFHWSGTATICCNDLDLKMTTGSWPESSLKELLTSPRVNWIKQHHEAGEREKLTLCRDCTVYRPKL